MRYPYSSRPRAQAGRVYLPTRRRRRWISTPWLLYGGAAGLISLFLLPFLLVGGTVAYYTLTDRVFPGVKTASFSAGDLTRAELAEKIDAEWNTRPRLVLTDGARSWPVSPVELGLWIDPRATAERAYSVGRGPQALQEVLWLARFQSISFEPVLVFNREAARASLEQLAPQVSTPAQNAALRFENSDWAAVPGQDGSTIDIDATLERVSANPMAVISSGFYPLVLKPVAPEIADLTPQLEQLRRALDQPLRLRAYDPITDETLEWSVPRESFAGWVIVENQAGGVSMRLDEQRLSAYLDEWQAGLGGERAIEPFTPPANLAGLWQSGEPVSFTLRHNPTSYTVEAGDTLTQIAFKVGMPYWKIQQANPGIDPNRLHAGQALTIPSRNEMLPLPVVPGKRIVISISQQHLWTYENGQERSSHVISTGIDRSPTIPGIYQVQTHEVEAYASVWDLYMPHFMGIYEGWPGFMNGLHGLPTLSGGRQLWAGNLGRPVSYGCIILDLQAAEDLYNWAEEGVVVEIRP